jgi:hypothetical protein
MSKNITTKHKRYSIVSAVSYIPESLQDLVVEAITP